VLDGPRHVRRRADRRARRRADRHRPPRAAPAGARARPRARRPPRGRGPRLRAVLPLRQAGVLAGGGDSRPQSVWPTWSDDTDAAGYPTTYQSYTERGFELDHTPLADYLDQTIPGGLGSKLGQLLDVAYNIEYGAETDDQSTLNFLYLIGFTRQKRLQLFGESDERFHIRGGNDQVPARLAEELDGQITLGSELVAVSRTKGGGYRLTFEEGGLRRT
jgi:hypothetical protein